MNKLINYIKSLFAGRRTENESQGKSPLSIKDNLIIPANTSCLVRGLIKSIMEEPDQWSHSGGFCSTDVGQYDYSTTKHANGTELLIRFSKEDGRVFYVGICDTDIVLPDYELVALSTAFNRSSLAIVMEYRTWREKEKIKITAESTEEQKRLGHFESLGCPDNTIKL